MFRFVVSSIPLIVALAVTPAIAQGPAPGCSALQPLFPGMACVANAHGVAVASSETDAVALLSAAASPARV